MKVINQICVSATQQQREVGKTFKDDISYLKTVSNSKRYVNN